jgi:hypothetical protein
MFEQTKTGANVGVCFAVKRGSLANLRRICAKVGWPAPKFILDLKYALRMRASLFSKS